MFSHMGSAAFKKHLTNIRLLCKQLNDPQVQLKTIHVGGTNGKGSVSHMLAATLQTAGYKTGLYTSPHVFDFRERIKVNGAMVSEDFVVGFVERIQPHIETIKPSFFEITVVMAFEYFVQENVDIAVIEVGLGGRLDSTNIITPELSVITNIGWDHTNLLGNTLKEIAAEKAGIIKENIPVVVGERRDEVNAVFGQTAAKRNAPLVFAEDRYRVVNHHWQAGILVVQTENTKNNAAETFALDLPGIYQLKNVCTALSAIDELRHQGWKIKEADVKEGLQHAKQLTGLSGRWELIHQHPMVVLEVAHNKDGVAQMVKHLQNVSYRQLHIVLGMVKDKEAAPVLQQLPANATYYFTQAQIPRALQAADLQQQAFEFALKGESYPEVNIALGHALNQAGADDLIIVCGSIFLVAEVKQPLAHS
jgi:dihydrofolate synthase/folylpolyglutamate synthase